jgi:hypothetical protein
MPAPRFTPSLWRKRPGASRSLLMALWRKRPGASCSLLMALVAHAGDPGSGGPPCRRVEPTAGLAWLVVVHPSVRALHPGVRQ